MCSPMGLCHYTRLLIQCKESKNRVHGNLLYACLLQMLEEEEVVSAAVGHDAGAGHGHGHGHGHGAGHGHDDPVVVPMACFPTLLLQMYASCDAREDAQAMFALPACTRDAVAWNSMLALHHHDSPSQLQLFHHMLSHSHLVIPNRATFLIALSACQSNAFADDGLHLHSCIVEHTRNTETSHDVILGTGLVSMYGRCRSVEHAWETFSKMSNRDTVAWNAMITVYSQNGLDSEVIQLFQLISQDGLIPNKVTYLVILDACCNSAYLAEGKRIHSCIWHHGLDVSVGNALINMYNKCGNLEDVREMFDEMCDRNVISWTTLISALVQHGYGTDALQAFHQMQVEGVIPNKVTFLSIFPACVISSMGTLIDGCKVHALLGHDAELDNVLGNALVHMYGKCDQVELAEEVFARMCDRDVVSWNIMISIQPWHSIQFLWQMKMESLLPNKATFSSILTACTTCVLSLAFIKCLHAQIVASGLDTDAMVVTSLVNIYGKRGFMDEAWLMMDSSNIHDMVMYNAIIASYTHNGHSRYALQLLYQSLMEGFMPDKATFLSILDACGNLGSPNDAKKMHVIITSIGLQTDTSVNNALLVMYGKCGRIEEADRIFESSKVQDVITWNVMIMASGYSGEPGKAILLFEVMQTEGTIPDKATFASLLSVFSNEESLLEGTRMHARIVGTAVNEDVAVQNALISMYGKGGNLDQAKAVFDRISNPDMVSWNALIAAHVLCGETNQALSQCSNLMQAGAVFPDKMIVITILSAFASEATSVEGRYLHICIVENGMQSDISVGNGLVNMYGKSGSLDDARFVFENMQQHDIVSWNAMIAAYAQHGQTDLAFDLFFKLKSKGLIPDKVTLVSILMACSHGGLVDEAFWFFLFVDGIKRTIDHYNCLIDLLGRAGRLHELECLMKSMPVNPTYASWMTLLDACRKHFDLERGEMAANCIMDLEPSKCASLVLLSNIYANAGRWEDVNKVKEVMRGNLNYFTI